MPTPLSPEEIERIATRRASSKMGWYIHACVYVVVNAFFYFSGHMGAHPTRDYSYPMLGWGLGLALHFLSVFVLGSGSGLRERMVERERERLHREQNRP